MYMCMVIYLYMYICTCVYVCMRVYIYAYVCMLVCACIKKSVKETCPLCQYTMYFREYSSKGLQLSVLLVMSVWIWGNASTSAFQSFSILLGFQSHRYQFIFLFRLRNFRTFCALVSSYKVFRCSQVFLHWSIPSSVKFSTSFSWSHMKLNVFNQIYIFRSVWHNLRLQVSAKVLGHQ